MEGRFDAAYVLPNSLKSALLPFLASIPKRVGYLGEARVGLLTHRLKNPKDKPPMVAFYSALSGEKEGLESDRPRLHLAPAQVDAALAAHRPASAAATTSSRPARSTARPSAGPPSTSRELARSLDRPAVLLGSGKEAELCEEIAARPAPGKLPQPCRQDLAMDAFALIAAARAVVSNDSGLMHVAAAFGVPQVAVFGSSSPLHTPPLNDKAQVVWLKEDPAYQPPLDCSPCFQRECPLGHTRCLYDITPERVLAAINAPGSAAPRS